MKQRLLIASGNRHKVEEIGRMLGANGAIEIVPASDFPGIEEPDETGSTFLDNAMLKAKHYSCRSGLPALADDSGLIVDALQGRPGIHSARYAPTPEARITRILEELKAVPDPSHRTARFACAMVVATPAGAAAATVGICEGTIAHNPRGTGGFGYDPIFLRPDTGATLAEMPPEEKDAISHRGRALSAMKWLLPGILKCSASMQHPKGCRS